MIPRLATQQLIKPEDITPSDTRFKVLGAFNPGVVMHGDELILLIRVAEAIKEERPDQLGAIRTNTERTDLSYTIDWLSIQDPSDFRKPLLTNGLRRLAYISHLEIARLDPITHEVLRIDKHRDLFGQQVYEEFGLEDARIIPIDGTYYITYVAVSERMGVSTALMSTTDFVSFTRHGIIFPEENKDVTLLPEKIGDHYIAFHRPVAPTQFAHPAILTAQSTDLLQWGTHDYFLGDMAAGTWGGSKVGMGAPPLKTEAGWLHFFHGVHKLSPQDATGTYSVGAALSHYEKPWKCATFTAEPIIVPEQGFELSGYVPNVVFPTGACLHPTSPDLVHIYYGAADQSAGCITLSRRAVLQQLGV